VVTNEGECFVLLHDVLQPELLAKVLKEKRTQIALCIRILT
jgi:hypothetical protein